MPKRETPKPVESITDAIFGPDPAATAKNDAATAGEKALPQQAVAKPRQLEPTPIATTPAVSFPVASQVVKPIPPARLEPPVSPRPQAIELATASSHSAQVHPIDDSAVTVQITTSPPAAVSKSDHKPKLNHKPEHRSESKPEPKSDSKTDRTVAHALIALPPQAVKLTEIPLEPKTEPRVVQPPEPKPAPAIAEEAAPTPASGIFQPSAIAPVLTPAPEIKPVAPKSIDEIRATLKPGEIQVLPDGRVIQGEEL